MSPRIAVVYLARLKEGFSTFEAFAESYRKHPAGEAHDLIIVCKGFQKPGEFAAVSAIFTGIPHKIVRVPDDVGYDIHAYREAALRLSNSYICCLNTFSEVQTDNWLAKLWRNMSMPGVGMVGATGSLESLYSSYKVIHFVAWASNYPARFDRRLTRYFRWLINSVSPATMLHAKSTRRRVRRFLGDLVHNRPTVERLIEDYPGVWAGAISNNSTHSAFRDFPHFPNPHLRSNAFMVRRADFLAIPLEDNDKMAACRFESSLDGLSISMLKKGLDLLVVGADGVGYPMDQWATCGAFRSGDQSNLLVSDNQTRTFKSLTAEEKTTHQIMTWGGYSPDFGSDVELFGIPYGRRSASLAERVEHFKTPAVTGKARLFSIAIPTHDRIDLVLDAIKTVRHQNYENWEIAVFDNASRVPIEKAIKTLGDPRIRCERSDEFLPVTESWNRAIDMATGEYVTMIGDDDGIAPNYFERMNYLADRFGDPDLVFSNLYQFMHPGVVPGHREGYVADLTMADFLDGRDTPFEIDAETIRRSIDNSLRMRRSFMFNMPAFCCRRELLEQMRIDGQVLHSPFPDYYFANLALHMAQKAIAEPRRMAFQGVSKVSFGFTLINARTDDGFKVLNHDVANDSVYNATAGRLLPGHRYSSEYMVTMAYLADVIADPTRQPDFDHYRRHQIWQYIRSHGSLIGWLRTKKCSEIWPLLSPSEKLWMIHANTIHKLSFRFGSKVGRFFRPALRRLERDSSAYLHPTVQVNYRSGEHVTLFDVFKDIEDSGFARPTKIADVKPKSQRTKKPVSSASLIEQAIDMVR